MTSLHDQFRQALNEVGIALNAIDREEVDAICGEIARAGRIGLFGCGREGLALRGFTMRLFHLGLKAAYLGEMNSPPLRDGDMLLVSAGPGELATVTALMQKAKQAHARVCLVTGVANTPSARLADRLLTIPAQTMATDRAAGASNILPMGSAYEGAMFFLFEVMIGQIKADLGIDTEAMRARHTNME